MSSPTAYAFVALGSATGGCLRFALASLGDGRWAGLPLGTFAVNVLGCIAIGWIGAVWGEREWVRHLVMVGILGGFTTFSAFAFQTLGMIRDGRVGAGLAYAGLSVALCLLGVWLGWALGRP